MEVENPSSDVLPRRLRYIKVLRANGVDHGDIQDAGLIGGGSGLVFTINEVRNKTYCGDSMSAKKMLQQGIENIAFPDRAELKPNDEADRNFARSVHSEEPEMPEEYAEELVILGVVPITSTSGDPTHKGVDSSSPTSSPLEAYIVSQSDTNDTPTLIDEIETEINPTTEVEVSDVVTVLSSTSRAEEALTSPLRKRKRSEIDIHEASAAYEEKATSVITEKNEENVHNEFKKPALPSGAKNSIAAVQKSIGMMSLPLHDNAPNFMSSIPSSTYMGTPIDTEIPQEEPLIASTIPDSDGEDDV